MSIRYVSPYLAILALASVFLLSACSGSSKKDTESENFMAVMLLLWYNSNQQQGPTQPNDSSITSVIISGTTDEDATVVVNGQADSNPDPRAFSVLVPLSETATGAELLLEVTATDQDMNSSEEFIDLDIVK